uniref:ATP synthase F0 subunit 8 n=1 Tax=Stephanomia amphytridis TaxID=645353 RepID=UPI0026E1A5B4|nr:ATP synthase F0 subunit 8 [Stephanomia amphytridis]WJJ70197.1 ATP synthase F0 subunit 8 [Stephanomia amphytridis]
MSQLDMSISFYHITGLIFCFYIFIHLVSIILIKHNYNKKVRLSIISLEDFLVNENYLNFIKKIFKI